ncbi:MAG: aspartate ammonia-lyase [Negativicutes bacterium]|jgi:aspartate ammonia-lyase
MRIESDFIGELQLPDTALYGIHSVRARENFAISGRIPHRELIRAYAEVKAACAEANMYSGGLSTEIGTAIVRAAQELAAGRWFEHIIVDALQGGAGTSLNMNVNEVIANRALELLGKPRGAYDAVSPLRDVNMSQSTNDTFPTALRIAAIRLITELSENCAKLQGALQAKEREFAGVLKVGRTQLQDAVPMTLGSEFGAWAEAVARDRWRLYKTEERLREVNLGGTAIGTGINAERKYIFTVIEQLRGITGIGLARKENLIDATQNCDVFVEVSGILKTCAVNMAKIAADIRLLASGPRAGIGELRLPDMQAGSSIMPGKVNPVMTEALTQASWQMIAADTAITYAAQGGQLELNAFLPLIADNLLNGINVLNNAIKLFTDRCISGIQANGDRCLDNLEQTAALITAIVPQIGYAAAAELVKKMLAENISAREALIAGKFVSDDEFETVFSVEKIIRPG